MCNCVLLCAAACCCVLRAACCVLRAACCCGCCGCRLLRSRRAGFTALSQSQSSSCQRHWACRPPASVRKRHFLRHLYIKINILPRQARDEHRENSKKVPFSQAAAAACQREPQKKPCRRERRQRKKRTRRRASRARRWRRQTRSARGVAAVGEEEKGTT